MQLQSDGGCLFTVKDERSEMASLMSLASWQGQLGLAGTLGQPDFSLALSLSLPLSPNGLRVSPTHIPFYIVSSHGLSFRTI